jgi:hypothetical protein
LDATEIEVAVTSGEVILSGTVDSRQAKRIAEDIAESISGVKEVQNQIRVVQGGQPQTQQEQFSTTGRQTTASTQEQGQQRRTART